MSVSQNQLTALITDDLNGTPLLNIISLAADNQRLPYDGIDYEAELIDGVLNVTPVFSYEYELEPNESKDVLDLLNARSNSNEELTDDEAEVIAIAAEDLFAIDYRVRMNLHYIDDFEAFEDNAFAGLYSELSANLADIKQVVKLSPVRILVTTNINADYVAESFYEMNRW